MHHVRNVETLNSEQSAQLWAQLERKGFMLRRAVMTRDEAAKRKESIAVLPSQVTKPYYTTSKSKKSLTKTRKAYINGNKEIGGEKQPSPVRNTSNIDESLPAEEPTQVRIKTRNMGSMHVSVHRVITTTLQDPTNQREAIEDLRAKLWMEARRKEIEALKQNDTWV